MERGSGRLFSASRLSNNNKNTAASATQSYKSVSVPHLQKAKPQKSRKFAPLWPFFGPKLPQCHRTITEWRYKNFNRNQYRDLFSNTKFSETETETFFLRPNSLKPNPKPSKNRQKSRNREVPKPKCQSLWTILPQTVPSQDAWGRVGVEVLFGQMPFESQKSLSGTSHKRTFSSHPTDFYLIVSIKIHLLMILGNRRIAEKQISM